MEIDGTRLVMFTVILVIIVIILIYLLFKPVPETPEATQIEKPSVPTEPIELDAQFSERSFPSLVLSNIFTGGNVTMGGYNN